MPANLCRHLVGRTPINVCHDQKAALESSRGSGGGRACPTRHLVALKRDARDEMTPLLAYQRLAGHDDAPGDFSLSLSLSLSLRALM